MINLKGKDWKELYNLCLDLIEKFNRSRTLKQLKEDYYDYFESDFIKKQTNKEHFIYCCMLEEERYKGDYTKEELIECINGLIDI